jgi:hypothetical protein
VNVNREYKNSVFTFLFNNEDKARELYAALKGIACDPAVSVIITTLQDILYMGRMNDLSFIVGSVMLFIIEHQSTLNPNIPLRILQYYAEICKKTVDRKALYQKALEKIPKPEFIVFYNGTDDTPDQWEERLSDAFVDPEGDGKNTLDLVIRVYNINKGRNPELLSRSESLAGYAEFVAQVRENEKAGMPLEDAVSAAIRRCVRDGILASFLKEHGSEVMNMLLEEWNWDEAKEVWQEEARAEGREEAWEMAEAKYQPVIAEKDRENEWLRRKLREAGIDPRQN